VFSLLRNHHIFSKVAIHFTLPPHVFEGFNFFHNLTNTCYCLSFSLYPVKGSEMVAHCGFDLHFPSEKWCRASFPGFIGYSYIIFGEMSIETFCLFFKIGVFIQIFYIWLAKVFSHSVNGFHFLDGKIFFFCTGVWTLGLVIARQVQLGPPALPCFSCFSDRISCFCLGCGFRS
jgi:hypothetical protein